jgi:hypothetical protein
MKRPASKIVRRRFFLALGLAVHLTWPVLSTILAIQIALGLLIGLIEGLVCRRRDLFRLRYRLHDWLWRYGTAAGACARNCDRDWFSGLFFTGL